MNRETNKHLQTKFFKQKKDYEDHSITQIEGPTKIGNFSQNLKILKLFSIYYWILIKILVVLWEYHVIPMFCLKSLN